MTETQRVWKLTDRNMRTRDGCQWKLGKWNPMGVRGGKASLCTPSWYHAYPWLDGEGGPFAVLMNPDGANIQNPRLWIAEVRGITRDADDFLKLGVREMRLIQEAPCPVLTDDDYTAIAIHIAGTCDESERDAEWELWAEGWLSNRDRTADSADWASASARAWAMASAMASARASARARASAWAWEWASARASARARASAMASARDEFHANARDAIVAWKAGVGT